MEPYRWGYIGSASGLQNFKRDLGFTSHRHEVAETIIMDHKTVAGIQGEWRALLHSGIDAIYIASAVEQHFFQVRDCILAHKPVLCERPVAKNSFQLGQLIQLSLENNSFMMEGVWIRFLPSIRKVLSIISSGAIGKVISLKAIIRNHSMDLVEGIENNSLLEMGVYPVFLCTLFLGVPKNVRAKRQDGGEPSSEYFSAFLSYEGGEYALIESGGHNWGSSTAVITGDRGQIKIRNPWSPKPEGIEVDLTDGTTILHKAEWEGGGLQFELDEVYDCVQNGWHESPLYQHQFSMDVMHTLERISGLLQQHKMKG